MIKKILLFLIFFQSSCQMKQEVQNRTMQEPPPPPKPIDENRLIGFACYYSGEKSESVKMISALLINKDYARVKEKLFDISTAERYLATVACEKLKQKGLITLNAKELNQIEQ